LKKRNTILGSLIALGLTAHLRALPTDPSPVNGQVQIQNGANFVQILQQTPQAIINWGQFNIGLGETVRFLQPSQQAAILNRVTGLDPSVLQGTLQANGRVFLLNPNGILFGPNSVVDVGSFTASTLKMTDQDFLNGTYKLTQDRSMPLAALTNQGTIKVAEGGFVVLVSPLLDNQGLILAQAGQVQLGAGTQATFSVDGRGLIQFALPEGFDPQFQAGGKGGTVLLQPGQISQLLNQVVTNTALVEAGSFQSGANGQVLAHGAEGILLNSGTVNTDGGAANGGTIRLDSSQATILPAAGVLSANSQNGSGGEVRLLSAGQTVSQGSISAATSGTGRGGFVEASGKNLWFLGTVDVASARGTGGTILIDPTDIQIIDGAGGTFDPNLPNPGNAGAGSVSVNGMQGFSAVTLNASHDVTYNGAGFTLPGTSLSVIAGNDILLTSSSTIQATTLNLQATRDLVFTGTGAGGLTSSSGDLTITAGRDVSLTSNNDLNLSSPSQIIVSAGRDLSLFSPAGLTMRLNAPTTTLNAARNLSLRTSNANPTVGPGALVQNAGNISWTDPGSSSFFLRAGSVTVNATNNFTGNASNGNFDVRTTSAPVNVTAGQSLAVNASLSTVVQVNGAGGVTLSAPTVEVLGGNGVFLTGTGDVRLSASSGDLNVHANNNQLQLGSSSGGLTLSATGDVLMDTSNDMNLSSATATLISAGRDLSLLTPSGLTLRFNAPVTTLNAVRNLSLRSSNANPSVGPGTLVQNAGNISWTDPGSSSFFLRAGNLTVNATNNFTGNASNGNWEARSAVSGINVTAGQNFAVNAAGSTVFQADTAGPVSLTSPALDLRANNGVFVNAVGAVNLTASNGNLNLHGSGNQLQLGSSTGGLILSASGDVLMDTSNDMNLSSATATLINAGRDLSLLTPSGLTMRFNAPVTTLNAVRNLSLRSSNANPSVGPGTLVQNAGNISWTDPGGSSFFLRAGNLTVNATNNFTGNASNGNWEARSSVSGINATAGQNFAVNATGTTIFQADNAGRVSLTAPAVDLRANNGVFVNAVGDVRLTASNGDLNLHGNGNQLQLGSSTGGLSLSATGDVLMDTNNDMNLSSATATLINAGRDLSLLTPSGLTMRFNAPVTTLNAVRNLSLRSSNANPSVGPGTLVQNAGNISWTDPGGSSFALRAGNLTVNATNNFTGNASNGNWDARSSVSGINVTAGQNFAVNAAGSSIFQADNAGGVSLTAPAVDLRANNGVFVNAVGDVKLTASNGDLNLHGNGNQLQLGSSTGGLSLSATGDALMDTSNDMNLSSATATLISAGRDLSLLTPSGLTMRFNAPVTTLNAVRNLSLRSSNANPSVGPGSLVQNAGNISWTDPGSSSFFLRAGNVTVNATNNFTGNASNGNFQVTAANGLNATVGGNFVVNATGAKSISADSDRLSLGAGNIALSGVTLTANNNVPLLLNSTGNLSVGVLATAPGANATLSGANIAIDSMQNVTGGNYTINTPGNLTEVTAATNPQNLTGLNISAGRVFNSGSGSGKFSIPNVNTPGALAALVTAGNDSVFQSSASFQTFNGAVLNPGHIDHQTGDIYVNGILVYGGLPPVQPPSPPPPPPPTPTPELLVTPSSPQAAPVQNQVTPEQRAQILAQSNLALGNLGSFSRELSNSERSQLSARMDSLHQTWPLDPFSPTLALTVPGGPPAVYASELAQLQALLLLSRPADDPLDKDRGAYNVIVDQELREIWEVRYWRHLLEGFIIWEDRE
jgi:filamentous hemagglutinin family protein